MTCPFLILHNFEQNMTDTKYWRWFSVASLNGTLSFSTYTTYNYEDMPDIQIAEKYKELKTIEDLQAHPYSEINSPTSCYFETNKDRKEQGQNNDTNKDEQGQTNDEDENEDENEENEADNETDDENDVFFRDQQDCIVWRLEASTGYVYVKRKAKNDQMLTIYVAKSLPEFLSRVEFESDLWHQLWYNNSQSLSAEQDAYVQALKNLV